jgi:hypothetical protein
VDECKPLVDGSARAHPGAPARARDAGVKRLARRAIDVGRGELNRGGQRNSETISIHDDDDDDGRGLSLAYTRPRV